MRREKVDRNRRADARIVLWGLLIFLCCGIDIAGAIEVPKDAAAFDLKEISAFDVPEIVKTRFIFGAYVICQGEPDAKARRYPAFQSDKPLYGSFHVGAASTEPNAGFHYQFAIDESSGSGSGYDRMYIDTNLNGDLTDDGICRPMKNVPAKVLLRMGNTGTQVCFEPIKLQITPGDGPSERLEVMPRLVAYASDRQYAMLATTKARTGTIKIGADEFNVVLGHSRSIPGWFDHPDTGFHLFQASGSSDRLVSLWYGGDRLMTMHRSGDTYYRFSATPSGDKLFVWPYRGPFGTLELQAGKRTVQNMSLSGSLSSKDAVVSLTDNLARQSASAASSFRVPVGDYSPALLNVTYDTLNCLMLHNNHADGLPGGRSQQGPPVYAIQIREDKPFVLDFSGKPQVIFASPAKDCHLKPGDELEVKAVLIDPSLDVMFRRVGRDDSQNPRVVVKRSNGEIVAEGVMPFG